MKHQDISLKLSLAAGGVVVALILLECAAVIFTPRPPTQASPALQLQADSTRGYRMAASQAGYTLQALATINRFGFRGPDWRIEKPTDSLRVAFVGDSYTFGYGVLDDQSFPAIIERLSATHSQPFESLNFGVYGYETQQELMVLREEVPRFHPDVVVFQFCLNDLDLVQDFAQQADSFKRPWLSKDAWKWRVLDLLRHSRVAMLLMEHLRHSGRGLQSSHLKYYVLERQPPPNGPGEVAWQSLKSAMEVFSTEASKHGFTPIFLVVPTPEEIVDQTLNAPYHQFIQNLASSADIPFLDVLHDFHSVPLPGSMVIPHDGHFTAEGNSIIARRVFAEILSATGWNSQKYHR